MASVHAGATVCLYHVIVPQSDPNKAAEAEPQGRLHEIVVGGGLLVTETLIVTCIGGPPTNGSTYKIGFPLLAPDARIGVTVIGHRGDRLGVSILRIDEPLPPGASPAHIIPLPGETWGRRFRAYGGAGPYSTGMYIDGSMRGRLSPDMIEIKADNHIFRSGHNFVGFTVIDADSGNFFGLITTYPYDASGLCSVATLDGMAEQIPDLHVVAESGASTEPSKPVVFIASSVEGKPIAEELQTLLQYDAYVEIWDQGTFNLSSYTIDDLLEKVESCDFGIFVFNADDTATIRGTTHSTVRDNVILELGIFLGVLKRKRCFLVSPRDVKDLHLPSDLQGITPAPYSEDAFENNPTSALGPASTKIKKAMNKEGKRKVM